MTGQRRRSGRGGSAFRQQGGRGARRGIVRYVTRVLSGNADFTLKTMSKLAFALGLQLEVGLGPQRLPSAAAKARETDAR